MIAMEFKANKTESKTLSKYNKHTRDSESQILLYWRCFACCPYHLILLETAASKSGDINDREAKKKKTFITYMPHECCFVIWTRNVKRALSHASFKWHERTTIHQKHATHTLHWQWYRYCYCSTRRLILFPRQRREIGCHYSTLALILRKCWRMGVASS